MNIIEALKTGRPFRRKDMGDDWLSLDPQDCLAVPVESLLSDNWEVKPEIVEISREEYFKALSDWAKAEYVANRMPHLTQVQYVDYVLQGMNSIWEQLKKNGKTK